jgi:hypothetical protein
VSFAYFPRLTSTLMCYRALVTLAARRTLWPRGAEMIATLTLPTPDTDRCEAAYVLLRERLRATWFRRLVMRWLGL